MCGAETDVAAAENASTVENSQPLYEKAFLADTYPLQGGILPVRKPAFGNSAAYAVVANRC